MHGNGLRLFGDNSYYQYCASDIAAVVTTFLMSLATTRFWSSAKAELQASRPSIEHQVLEPRPSIERIPSRVERMPYMLCHGRELLLMLKKQKTTWAYAKLFRKNSEIYVKHILAVFLILKPEQKQFFLIKCISKSYLRIG